MLPPNSYFVCTTPRSGSTLLCETLARTGLAGRPNEWFEALRATDTRRQPRQYFDEIPPDIEELLPIVTEEPQPELARAGTYLDYLDWVATEGTTPNGVFGAKIMWGHVHDLAGRLRELRSADAQTDVAVFRDAFPRARFVRIVRTQKIEQAVSLWKAIQTQHWRAGANQERTRREPVYHEWAIATLARQLFDHERRWTEFFDQLGAEPLTISYDDIVGDLRGTVVAVLEHLGVAVPEALEVRPLLRRQADERSQEWVRRFVADNRAGHAAAA
ncbi:MAG TPA: Stf0 family sulfotransferase [Solirubrobacteraceae bacterium]|jgi:LPS sulfotransferase NodH